MRFPPCNISAAQGKPAPLIVRIWVDGVYNKNEVSGFCYPKNAMITPLQLAVADIQGGSGCPQPI
jgi:hypothetical protein